MRQMTCEIIAWAATIGGLILAATWPFAHEASSVRARAPEGARVVTLTGVADSGTWTGRAVTGANYWTGPFPPARPELRAGEPVLLRLKSADVVHGFYCPELGIGPVEVYPGRVVEIELTPQKTGVFGYYCTTVCGDPHFAMRGELVVVGPGAAAPGAAPGPPEPYWLEPAPPATASRVDRGGWLFRRHGCAACHGEQGRGGVANANYVKDTVPALDRLAERMMLFEREDAAAIIAAFERGQALSDLAADPPVEGFGVVIAQYRSIRDVIRNGNEAGRKDPTGPAPPLEMPAWEQRLSADDVDAIVAYLLSVQPWEEDDADWDEEEEDDDE